MGKFDYLIVGAGLAGSTIARLLKDKGKSVLVIDKRDHIGGLCYDYKEENIIIHKYGPHIFHTNNKGVLNFVKQFTDIKKYRYKVLSDTGDKLYSFPINLFTLYQLWGVKTPREAREKIDKEKIKINNPDNLEDYILSMVGETIYETFIKKYTQKQWGRSTKELPTSIVKRIPIRFTFDDNYYFDYWQGMIHYSEFFKYLLQDIPVQLNTEYFGLNTHNIADKIVYTGMVDQFFNYKFGELEYRSLLFANYFNIDTDSQGISVINQSNDEAYTRSIEHKHFHKFVPGRYTFITEEYPQEYKQGVNDPYYPINTKRNEELLKKYNQLVKKQKNVFFIGRLAEYKYYDMTDIIEKAIKVVYENSFFNSNI